MAADVVTKQRQEGRIPDGDQAEFAAGEELHSSAVPEKLHAADKFHIPAYRHDLPHEPALKPAEIGGILLKPDGNAAGGAFPALRHGRDRPVAFAVTHAGNAAVQVAEPRADACLKFGFEGCRVGDELAPAGGTACRLEQDDGLRGKDILLSVRDLVDIRRIILVGRKRDTRCKFPVGADAVKAMPPPVEG